MACDTSLLNEAVGRALLREVPGRDDVLAILRWPEDDVIDLVARVSAVRHRFFGRRVKLNFLLNIKSGLCPEDCSYCSQSRDSSAPIARYTILPPDEVVRAARAAVDCGAKRLCVVAAGRGPARHEVEKVARAVEAVRAELPALEICACLGLLREGNAQRLRESGVHAYNHNLNTSSRHYPAICSTHTYHDRIGTVEMASRAGLSPCSGILVGIGETDEDIADVALDLRRLHPDSVPVNFLIPIDGTPLQASDRLTPRFCLKVLAAMRLVFPDVEVRIAGGREVHLRTLQPLGLALANSIFIGDYLTTKGQAVEADLAMIEDSGYMVEGAGEATLPRQRAAAELRTEWPGHRASKDDDAASPTSGQWLGRVLAEQRDRGLWREPLGSRSRGGGRRELAGAARCVGFTSNDYLGLADDSRLADAAAGATAEYGSGATGSRLLSGAHPLLERLEDRLAGLEGTEAALVVGSGYLANMAVLQALGGGDATVFSDALNHASIIDGARLSRARVVVYPHRDLGELERLLTSHRARRAIIVTDAVFGMEGTVAPLAGVLDLADRHDAWLVVDDAHGTGVFGRHGSGTWAHLGLPRGEDRVIHVGTLSKALGGYGGFIASTANVRDLLLNRGRTVIFSTAPAPSLCATGVRALEVCAEEPWRADLARAHGDRLRVLLRGIVDDVPAPRHPVVPVPLGTPERAMTVARRLVHDGFLVQAVRPPTVPEGTSRLRLSPTAAHSESDIESLAAAVLDALA